MLAFQPRAHHSSAQQFAPHFHLYVELPADVELWYDPFTRGPSWEWACQAWWEIVKSGDRHHCRRSVHIRPCSYTSSEETRANAKRVGDYLWRESGETRTEGRPLGL